MFYKLLQEELKNKLKSDRDKKKWNKLVSLIFTSKI